MSTPPVSPTGITVIEGDADGGAILQTRRAKIDWNFPGNASGCGTEWGFSCAGNQNEFTLQISGGGVNQSFTLPSTARTYTSGPIFTANATYTITVCADNGALQTCASTTKAKVPYPTGAITGNFMERDADTNACFDGIRGLPAMTMTTSLPAGATTSCTATPGAVTGSYTGYSCTIVLDNVNNDPVPVGHQLSIAMTPTNIIYTGAASCGPGSAGGTCAGGLGSCANLITADFDANGTVNTATTRTAYFGLNNAYPFYKIKNASYYRESGISSLFPLNHRSYDTDDTPLVGHFNRGETAANSRAVGPVLTNGTQTVGALGASNGGVSAPGWRNEGYTAVSRRTGVSQFIEYVRARKDYTVITSLGDAAFTGGSASAYIMSGDLTIDAGNAGALTGKDAIIIATGSMNISANVTPANAALALVSPSIYIGEGVGEVNALVAGNTISLVSRGFTGNSATPLKITGNLFSGAPVDTTRRLRADSFSPSFFVIQDASVYSTLLPSISVVKYDWKQLQ